MSDKHKHTEQHSVIKFLVHKNKTNADTHTLKSTAVKKWVGRFRSGRELMSDDAWAGRLATACNVHNVEKVKREIKKDRQKMIRDVADSTNITRMRAHKILRQNLEMKKVCSKLFLKVLMLEQKEEQVFIAETFLNDCKADAILLRWIITGDESVCFRIWSIHKVSVNAVEEKRRTTTQKSSHGLVPLEIDVNFIFRRPRFGDGGMGAILEKCRRCFLYRNAPEIDNLCPKVERAHKHLGSIISERGMSVLVRVVMVTLANQSSHRRFTVTCGS